MQYLVFRHTLANNGFEGTVCFHIYNEPLIDPRLFYIIEYIKQKKIQLNVMYPAQPYFGRYRFG